MKLTIIKQDKSVYIDGLCYSNLSLPSIPEDVRALQFETIESLGHIEFVQTQDQPLLPNEIITTIPTWANDCIDAWNAADYIAKNPPAPSLEEKIANCKLQARFNLEETDWSEIPSVLDEKNQPHLLNGSEFIAYRSICRNYVANPVADPIWPTMPTAVWSV